MKPDRFYTQRLLELADLVEAMPRGNIETQTSGFNMSVWYAEFCPKETKECGSVLCIGGAAQAHWGLVHQSDVYEFFLVDPDDEDAYAVLDCLFYPPSYATYVNNEDRPIKYYEIHPAWHATPQQAANVIRRLAYTGETNWDLMDKPYEAESPHVE